MTTVTEEHRSTGWEWFSVTERVWRTAVRPLTPVNGSVSVKPPVISSRCTLRPVFSTGERNRERLSEPITWTESRFDSYKGKAPEPRAITAIHHNLLHALESCRQFACTTFPAFPLSVGPFRQYQSFSTCNTFSHLLKIKKWKNVGVHQLSMVCKPKVMQIISRIC